MVLDAVFSEFDSIVFGFVETDDGLHPKVLENLNVVFWLVASLLALVVHRAHEGDEFVRNDPV